MHLINHSLKKGAAIAAVGALMFSMFVSGGMVMAAPPAPEINPVMEETSHSTVTLSGNAPGSVNVNITGGVGTQVVTTDGSGNWTANVPLVLNSTNNIVVIAINATGQASVASTVTIVNNAGTNSTTTATTTPPTATTTPPTDTTAPNAPVIITPSPLSPHSTSTSPVTVSGTAEAGTVVWVSGGLTPAAGEVNASGNWTARINVTPDATSNLIFRARDDAGNYSAEATLTIIHTTPGTTTGTTTTGLPSAPVITYPTSPLSTSTSPVTLTGTAQAGAQVVIGGGAMGWVHAPVNASGNWTAQVYPWPDDTTTLTLLTRNANGDSPTVTFTIIHSSVADVTAPNAPVITFPISPVSTTTSPILVRGTAEAGSTVSVTGGSANASTTVSAGGTFSIPVGLNSSSTNTLVFVARDAAGNVSTGTTLVVTHLLATTTGTTTADVTAPNAPVVTFPISPYTTTSNAVVMTGTAEAGSTIRVTSGTSTSTVATTTTSGSGNFAVLLNLPNGTTTTFFITATDAAGNVSSSTSLVITQAPMSTGTTTATSTATTSPVITLNGDVNTSVFLCNISGTGYVDPGARAVTSSGATTTVSVSGFVSSTTTGTFTLTYTATSDGLTSTSTRTIAVLACSSGGGGGGGDNDDDVTNGGSSGDNSNNDNDDIIPTFIGVTPPFSSGGVLTPFVTVIGVPGTTQVLGASFVPGLPSTGAGEDAFKVFLPILLSFGVVLLGLSLGRKKPSHLS